MRRVRVTALAAALSAGLAAACKDAAPVTPSASTTITLTAAATQLPFNGTAMIVADLVDGTGQLAPNGTMVTFATTLGSIEPSQAATTQGRASATFVAGTVSGTAIITASAGTATTAPDAAKKIAIGAAAASRVGVVANPAAVPFNGGSSTITATVVDGAGKPLASIPVTFSTTAGTLTVTALKTDQDGNARTALTTAQPATVTAAVGAEGSVSGNVGAGPAGSASVAVTPRPQPTVSVAPSPSPTALGVTTFTIGAVPAANSGTAIQSVSINFGDGTRPLDLGAASGTNIVAQHVYQFAGTYTVSVTAVDTGGASATATALIVVAPQAPLSVAIAFAPPIVAGATTIYTFVATVMPATAVIASYKWTFGDGSAEQTTTGNQVAHSFRNGGGPYTVQLIVTSATGQTADTFTIISP